jgi:F0F1-type ATP synthase membrane subunit b/b'
VFRWVVGIAAWVICIAFLVQVVVWALLYLLFRRVMGLVDEYRKRFEPQIATVQATLGDVQATLAHVTETTNRLSTEVRAVSASVTTSAERITALVTDSAEQISSAATESAQQIRSLVSTGSTQVQTALQTTTDTAHTSVARVNLAVERTATRFEETGEYVQQSVIAPVREVAAIVTGVKVALGTLFGYPERKQINQVYQDEELFI